MGKDLFIGYRKIRKLIIIKRLNWTKKFNLFLLVRKRGINFMRTIIKDEDEVKIYHIVCDISKICKNYFYERKYLPKDCWSIDDVVKEILLSSK